MTTKIKSVLVTGGAGYIGSHTIAELISKGYDVVSVDNFSNSSTDVFERLEKLTGKKIENIHVDLCEHEKLLTLFTGKKFDAIIHFAAKKSVGDSVKDPLGYYRNNIGALLGALMIARECNIPYFVFSSSCAIYDPHAQAPYTEDSKTAPASPYGATKLLGEEILKDYTIHTPHLQAVSLRYFNPAGAHLSGIIGEESKGEPQNLIPVMIKAIQTKTPFTILGNDYPTPDGTCIRDYIHVMDVAEAHISALEHLASYSGIPYDVFNIGAGKGVSVMEMVKAFEKNNGGEVLFTLGERRAGDVPRVFADITKAGKMLGWKPKYSLDDILKTAWVWGQKNG